MQVTVQYFATLRVAAGTSTETWTINESETARSLFARISARHPISQPLADLRVAINDEFADEDSALRNGDKLVFIPPVSGG